MKSIDFIFFLRNNRNRTVIVGCSTILLLFMLPIRGSGMEIFMEEEKPLGMQINCIANQIRREIDKSIAGVFEDETSRSNGWIINYIATHPDQDVFQKDIEKAFSLTRSTISKVVELMVQKGFIVRSPVDYDARLKKLTLTPKAIRMHEKMHEGSVRFETRLESGFSEEELARLREYLVRLEANINRGGCSEKE